MAESKDLEDAAKAQVGRPRQRWCIGSGERGANRRIVLCNVLSACRFDAVFAFVYIKSCLGACLRLCTVSIFSVYEDS